MKKGTVGRRDEKSSNAFWVKRAMGGVFGERHTGCSTDGGTAEKDPGKEKIHCQCLMGQVA